MIGRLNNDEVDDVLRNGLIGRIGCHANGNTYIVPVCYVYDGTFIYARSEYGKKVEMMRVNPRVCFEVEAFIDLANWRTVVVSGEYEEITNEEERKIALQKLLQRHFHIVSGEMERISSYWPFAPDNVNSIKGIVYRISVGEKSGRFENYEGIDEISKPYL